MIKTSEELSGNLTEVAKSSFFQKNFDKVFKACFLSLAEPEPNNKSLDSIKVLNEDQSEVVFAFNIIFLLTSECLHANLLVSEVRTLLEEFITSKEMIDNYIEKYSQFRTFSESKDNDILDTQLNSSIPFNKLVDIEWKMLHTISSKHLMRIGKDVYLITLKYATTEGEIKSYTFKSSYEELMDLTESLTSACNAISKACDQNDLITKNA